MTDGERLLTRDQFESLTGIGEHKQRELAREGRLREIRLGRRCVRIPASEVARLARGEQLPQATQTA
jgi:excisionase family DNA binding protein